MSTQSFTTSAVGPRSRRGITMVETMITLVVFGIMLAMGLPKFNDSVRQRRVIAAANAVSADMPVAFSLAARQRKPVTLSYDASSGELRIADRASPDTIYLRRPLRTSSEYMLDSVRLSPAEVQLFPNGVSSAAFTVQLYNGPFVRRVSVGRTGLTRVIKP